MEVDQMAELDNVKTNSGCPGCHGAGIKQVFKKTAFSPEGYIRRISKKTAYIVQCPACGCNGSDKVAG